MSNLLDKASIILTPTAYNNGEALCVKPSDGSGDFDFSRNSAATRVNAQGLVENVQILSSNLVQNGDFSEEGAEEVSNGSFSQEGAELITNGDFTNNIDGWLNYISVSTWDNGTIKTTCTLNAAWIRQNNVVTANKYYKVTFKAKASNISQNIKIYNGTFTDTGLSFDEVDVYQEFTYYLYTTVTDIIIGQQTVSVGDTINFDNVSVREVGQDWVLTSGASIGENKLDINANAYDYFARQLDVSTIGKTYKVSVDAEIQSGRMILYLADTNAFEVIDTSGSYTFYIVADGTQIRFRAFDTALVGSITNISVKEVGQNWTLGTGWSIGDDKVIATSVSNQFVTQPFAFTSGKRYRASFSVTGTSSLPNNASLRLPYDGDVSNIAYVNKNSDGVYSHEFVASGTLNTLYLGYGSFTGTITNISAIQITDDTNLPRINYEGFSYQDALGSEEIVNGTFDSDTAWSKGAGWSIANGEATHTGSASYLSQSILNPNTQYKVKIKVSQASGSNFVQIYMGGSPASVLIQNVGEYEYIFTSQPSIGLGFALRGAGNVTIDNVSVKEYLGQEVVPDSGCGSWLFESQSTNLVTDSEDYSQWTPTGVSVTSNSTTSPDGLINGTLLSTNGGTSSRLIRNYGLPTSATIKVLSIYAKANLSNFIQLLLNGDAQSYVNFDVSNGVVGTSGTKTTGEIQSVGNGWYRCIAYFDSTTIFGASSFVALTISNSVGYSGYATSDDLNVYIWGSQYEENNISSYIPTSGSTVTRNQDVCTNGGSLATINSTEGVLYAEIAALADGVGTRTMSLSDGTANNSITIRYTTSVGVIQAFVVSGGSFQFNANISGVSVLDFNKVAIKYSLNDMALWINGVEVATDTSGTMPLGLNEINFTRGDGANKFFGKTKAVAVWKEALSDSELQSLTTI